MIVVMVWHHIIWRWWRSKKIDWRCEGGGGWLETRETTETAGTWHRLIEWLCVVVGGVCIVDRATRAEIIIGSMILQIAWLFCLLVANALFLSPKSKTNILVLVFFLLYLNSRYVLSTSKTIFVRTHLLFPERAVNQQSTNKHANSIYKPILCFKLRHSKTLWISFFGFSFIHANRFRGCGSLKVKLVKRIKNKNFNLKKACRTWDGEVLFNLWNTVAYVFPVKRFQRPRKHSSKKIIGVSHQQTSKTNF